MPFIDIWFYPARNFKPNWRGREPSYKATKIGYVVRKQLGPALPDLFIECRADLGLDPKTTAGAVQVQPHEYDPDTVNGVDIWIRVQFTEPPGDEADRAQIAEAIWYLLEKWFVDNGFELPENMALDVFWGPASGYVKMNGETIRY